MDFLERLGKIIESYTTRKLKIAIAESCTGGYISHMITNISGASKVFERGIVCYSNKAKIDLLNIEPKSLEIHGAVSKNIVEQLAYNIRALSNVDIGIGISGIAGPAGGTPEKPVGTVYIGFSSIDETYTKRFNFSANRIMFKKLVLEKIIEHLEQIVKID